MVRQPTSAILFGMAVRRTRQARSAPLPFESGAKRREQGLAKAGNARIRRGMIPLAWRFLRFQKDIALARWYKARTARGGPRHARWGALHDSRQDR